MTLDDTIKEVLELDEKAKWLTYHKLMAGVPTPINDSYTAPICIGTLKEICEAIESYRTAAPLLARACQRMKSGLIDECKCIPESKYSENWICNSCKVLADVEKMFEEGK